MKIKDIESKLDMQKNPFAQKSMPNKSIFQKIKNKDISDSKNVGFVNSNAKGKGQ